MNTVNIIGNLTKDPDVRYGSEKAVCRMNVAVNDGYGDNQRTSFISVVAFGKTAENCERYLAKGRKVAVTGRLQTGSYEKDGVKHYTTDVIASSVEFLNSSNGEQKVPQEKQGAFEPPQGFASVSDDEIPF